MLSYLLDHDVLSPKFNITKNSKEKIDSVIAMAIYTILMLDYITFFNEMKKFSQELNGISLTIYNNIVKLQEEIPNFEIDKMIMEYIFNKSRGYRENLLDPTVYSALISVILEIEFQPENWKEKKDINISQLVNTEDKIIKRRTLMKYLIEYIDLFNKETRNELDRKSVV